jgi:phosphonate transport system ATP-binding protein
MEQNRVLQALERVGLGDRQWEGAANLSGGEAQRVCVARALLNGPRVVLADEPTASLDPVNAEMVTDLLVEDAEERNVTLLFSTHWVSLIAERFDRVIGVREGRIVLDAPPGDLDAATLDDLYMGSDERR